MNLGSINWTEGANEIWEGYLNAQGKIVSNILFYIPKEDARPNSFIRNIFITDDFGFAIWADGTWNAYRLPTIKGTYAQRVNIDASINILDASNGLSVEFIKDKAVKGGYNVYAAIKGGAFAQFNLTYNEDKNSLSLTDKKVFQKPELNGVQLDIDYSGNFLVATCSDCLNPGVYYYDTTRDMQ